MTSLEAWTTIINKLTGKSIELHTVPKTKKEPGWFSATTDGELFLLTRPLKINLQANYLCEEN